MQIPEEVHHQLTSARFAREQVLVFIVLAQVIARTLTATTDRSLVREIAVHVEDLATLTAVQVCHLRKKHVQVAEVQRIVLNVQVLVTPCVRLATVWVIAISATAQVNVQHVMVQDSYNTMILKEHSLLAGAFLFVQAICKLVLCEKFNYVRLILCY